MKHYLRNYFKLLAFARAYLGTLLLATLCMGISTILEGITFGSLAPIIDRAGTAKEIVIPQGLPEFLNVLVAKFNAIDPLTFIKFLVMLVPLLFLLKGGVVFFQEYLMNIIGQGVVREVRNSLYSKFQALSMDFYGRKRTGELISRITNDVTLITNAISYGLKDLIFESMKVVFFTIATLWLGFTISWKLMLLVFVIFPIVMYPIIAIGRRIKKFSIEIQKRMADLNSHMVETIQGAHVVKAFGREDYEIERFRKINREYWRFSLKTIKRTAFLPPLTEFTGACLIMILVRVIFDEIISGKVSFGVFAVFVAFFSQMIRPMKKLSNVYAINQSALAASERIYSILEEEPKIKDSPSAVVIRDFAKEVDFQHVWFRYSEQDDYVLKDINFNVKKGESIALVGHSGAGKTTLVGLLPRFYDPQQGSILIDGIDIRRISIASLRSLFAIVSQEIVLFNASIRDNIAYGKSQASDADIVEAAKKANAYDFIMETPQKFDTIIGDRGFRLSGGEKQRIAIARAVLKNAPLLILDEATSNLDTKSEQLIQEALGGLMHGRTAFIVAHRLSTVQKANKIVVLDKGCVIDIGTHSQLLERNALYKNLHSLQFNV